MEITFQEKANHKNQESITTGIAFDLEILLSTIKGKTILMMNKAYFDHYYQSDINEILTLVEESIIRADLISIPVTNIKDLVCKPARLCD